MTRRGYTLMELLVGMIIFLIVMAGIFTAYNSMWSSQSTAIALSSSQIGAEQVEFVLAQAFQSATNCLSTDTGCVQGTPVQNATSNGCTVYTRDTNGNLDQTTYATSGSKFQQTINGVTTPLSSSAAVSLTYYSSSTYNTNALTAYTPTSSTAANLIAVQITVTDTTSGGNTSYSTFVRLRNGP
jgi:prepilin-type N-terminal cleavage/methylation domain-containing protein